MGPTGWLDMWQQQKTLAPLYEELRNIQVFDRVHDYATEPDSVIERAHAVRQARRRQIIDEIARLRAPKSHTRSHPARVTGALALISAVGYAMVHIALR